VQPTEQDDVIESVRSEIVANALWGVANAGSIHYAQLRPIDGLNHKHKLPLSTDCSGWVTLCYKWAGAPDPNGNGYNGQGFTGTLLNHLTHITRANAGPGDLVVFGSGSGHHVVVITGAGSDPEVVSHGQEKGPLRVRLSVELAAVGGPMTFLRSRQVSASVSAEDGISEQVELPADLTDVSNPPAEGADGSGT